jgi:hypothetical protein
MSSAKKATLPSKRRTKKSERAGVAGLKDAARKDAARKFAEYHNRAVTADEGEVVPEVEIAPEVEVAEGAPEVEVAPEAKVTPKAEEGEGAEGDLFPDAEVVLARAAAAWQSLTTKDPEVFEDWCAVARCIKCDTTAALNESRANEPKGEKFFRAYRKREEKRPWRDIDKTDRSRLRFLADHLEDTANLEGIRTWRNRQPLNRRLNLQSLWIVREYQKDHPETKKPRATPAQPLETQVSKLQKELEAAHAHSAELEAALGVGGNPPEQVPEQVAEQAVFAEAIAAEADEGFVQRIVRMVGSVARAKAIAQVIMNLPND